MKIQLISDVHMEFWERNYLLEFLLPADVLVVAGDLHMGRHNVLKALKVLSTKYDRVLYLPGNHEYYNGLHMRGFDWKSFTSKLPVNVSHLEPGVSVTLDGITFFGATLWTNFNNSPAAKHYAHKYINDFHRIPDAVANMEVIHREHLDWITNANFPGKKVIVTHFLPAMACVSPKYRDGDMVTQYLNRYFANSLDNWIATLEDATWLFGHTHDAVDVTIGTTRCLARPVGYPGEHPGQPYEPLILELI